MASLMLKEGKNILKFFFVSIQNFQLESFRGTTTVVDIR